MPVGSSITGKSPLGIKPNHDGRRRLIGDSTLPRLFREDFRTLHRGSIRLDRYARFNFSHSVVMDLGLVVYGLQPAPRIPGCYSRFLPFCRGGRCMIAIFTKKRRENDNFAVGFQRAGSFSRTALESNTRISRCDKELWRPRCR